MFLSILFSASPWAFFSHGSIKNDLSSLAYRNCPSGWTFCSRWWLALHFDIHGALAKCCYRCGCQMRATIQELWGLQLYGIRLVRSSLFQCLTSKLLRGSIRLCQMAKNDFLFLIHSNLCHLIMKYCKNIGQYNSSIRLIWCYFLMTMYNYVLLDIYFIRTICFVSL